MAKKQNLSKNKQAELLRKQGYTYKQINRMDSETRQKISTLIISDKEDKKKGITAPKSDNKTQRALQRANRITKKRFELEKQGFPGAMKRGKISDRQIDSIKLKDIESGRINRENYPFLYYDTKLDFDKVYRIMEESFPIDERRTYEEQKALLNNKLYSIYILSDIENDNIKAFIAIWQFDDFAFVEHFAVSSSYRNGGIGALILQEVQKLLSCMICLEVELPEEEMAKILYQIATENT